MNAYLTPKAEAEMEERFRLERRVMEIFMLVVAEWESDPMSVQCFDLRIVREATDIKSRLRKLGPSWSGS